MIGSTFAATDLVVVSVVFQAVLQADLRPWIVTPAGFVMLTVNDAWLRVADGRGFLEPGVLYPLLLTGPAVGLSLQSRQVRRQHDELLALRDADRRRAVSDERRRIARDLHDAAAHTSRRWWCATSSRAGWPRPRRGRTPHGSRP